MRYVHAILIGVTVPLILTATFFAVPSNMGRSDLATKTTDNSNVPDGQNLASTLPVAEAASSKIHRITLSAEQLSNGLLAYKMVSYTVGVGKGKPADITSKYPSEATIPGPTIVLNEGDQVFLKIKNDIGSGMVSVHVHGVHYSIVSDGTLKHINEIKDEGATPSKDYEYHWIAGAGTAGTWPYHDHTFAGINGAENKGLFGTVIVNPATGTVKATDDGVVKTVAISSISKNIVLYLGDDAFWGTEIKSDGTQRALWTNPHLIAADNELVRFHLIALGTDMHEFTMDDYQIVDPVTSTLVSTKPIGPLENLQFTLRADVAFAGGDDNYRDLQASNALMGVQGIFEVTPFGGDSISSGIPDAF